MAGFENIIWCDGCGAEILYRPYLVNKNVFCCQDCAQGFSCKCTRSMEWKEDYREPISIEIEYQEN